MIDICEVAPGRLSQEYISSVALSNVAYMSSSVTERFPLNDDYASLILKAKSTIQTQSCHVTVLVVRYPLVSPCVKL